MSAGRKGDSYVTNNTTAPGQEDGQIDPGPDESTIGGNLQSLGFYQSHRVIVRDCGWPAANLYAVLESYAQLSARYGKHCTPKQSALCEEMRCGESKLREILSVLVSCGWVETKSIAGNRTRYHLNSDAQRQAYLTKTGRPVKTKGLTQNDSDPRKSRVQNLDFQGSYNIQDRNKEIETEAPSISGQNQGENGARPGGAETKTRVSNQNVTYWTDPEWGERRAFQFQTIFDFYPKQDGEQTARQAWERRIGKRLDVRPMEADPFWKSLCFAAQWFRDEVARNKTEPKFITSFPNWIAGEKWNDAPRWVREGKAGPDAR